MLRQINNAAHFNQVPQVPLSTNRFTTSLETESWDQTAGKLVLEANAGDHSMIFQYLKTTLPHVTEPDFEYILDSPNYDPKNRFLIRDGSEILGHVRLESRTIQFGAAKIHTVDLDEVSVFPELENTSCERALMAAARYKAARLGASVLTRNISSGNVRSSGWATIPCGKHVAMCAHDLLGRIEAFQAAAPDTRASKNNYFVRPWRYIERSEVMEIFETATAGRDGVMERNDEYWQWMLARRGFDRGYVAVDKRESEKDRIVGYAFVRNNKIAELATDPNHPHCALSLLRRIALDAVELGIHSLVFLASSLPQTLAIPLESTFDSNENQSAFFATALSVELLAKQLSPVLFSNSKSEGLSTGTKLGIECGSESITLKVQRNRLGIQRGIKCESTISLSPANAAAMFLGRMNSLEAFEDGNISASGRLAAVIAAKIFLERDQMLRMPLNDLRSR